MRSAQLIGLLLISGALMLAGCSNAHELNTPNDAARFIVEIARGHDAAGWRPASGASGDAARVWAERGTIQDLGRRLRHTAGAWACEFAEGSGQMGYGGPFTKGDELAVTYIAKSKGAKPYQVKPLLEDVRKLANHDLTKATAAVCKLPL